MDWTHAFGVATSIGLVFGVIARVVPQVRNELVPRIAFVTTFLLNVSLLWGKFTAAAGLDGGVSLGTLAGHPLMLAGFWSLPGVHQFVVFCATTALSGVGLVVQRIIHEVGLKAVAGQQPALRAEG